MATSISFDLAHEGYVVIEAYNVLGQKVAMIADGTFPAGKTTLTWDGKSDSGTDLASGMYLYRMTLDGERACSRKMMILK
jgi:flagellar hook assembly protein FlgD